jgi:hypothetical protein
LIIFLNSINQLIFVMEKHYVFFEVRTKFLIIIIIMCSLHDVQEMNAYRADPVCLSIWFVSRTDGRILIKFSIDVMPVDSILYLYFLIPYNL